MVVPERKQMTHGGWRVYGGTPWSGCVANGRRIFRHRGKTYKVHRLVAEAFLGPQPFDGAVVMHLNEVGTDNRVENLKWGTQKENLNAPGFISYCKSRTGENSPTSKARKKAA